MTALAFVADVHLHDLRAGLRTWADTVASTRVFNESEAAFRAILSDIARRGIRDVVLPGDLTDDGQPGAHDAFERVIAPHVAAGMRFHALLGNHDAFGPERRAFGKVLTDADGLAPRICPQEGLSTPEALNRMQDRGLMGTRDGRLWETPFGTDPAPGARRDAQGLIDASYLTEPQPGLWLLMLDATLFERRGGGWHLLADGAWDHALARRPYLEPWIAAVVRRAAAAGAVLIAVSHYPMIAAPPPDWLPVAERARWAQRMPAATTTARLAATGITLHLGGHMHVPGETARNGLRDVALPSPVAKPGGYVIVRITGTEPRIERIAQPETPGFELAHAAYRRETPDAARALADLAGYAAFLDACAARR